MPFSTLVDHLPGSFGFFLTLYFTFFLFLVSVHNCNGDGKFLRLNISLGCGGNGPLTRYGHRLRL